MTILRCILLRRRYTNGRHVKAQRDLSRSIGTHLPRATSPPGCSVSNQRGCGKPQGPGPAFRTPAIWSRGPAKKSEKRQRKDLTMVYTTVMLLSVVNDEP